MKSRKAWCWAGAILAVTVGSNAVADAHGRTDLVPAYKQECGSCHIPYPPGLLPASSWERLMANLPRHFGTDASIDPSHKWLEGYLAANAGTLRALQEPSEDRVTRTPWFLREHRKVQDAVWRSASVKSAANCAACHPRADQADFDEHAVRIPR